MPYIVTFEKKRRRILYVGEANNLGFYKVHTYVYYGANIVFV